MLASPGAADWHVRAPDTRCAKCDDVLMEQGDGSTVTVDIAHNRETVSQALDSMDQVLDRAWRGYVSRVRLIVGGGVIREAVLGELTYRRQQGAVLGVVDENRGAVLVTLRYERN